MTSIAHHIGCYISNMIMYWNFELHIDIKNVDGVDAE